MSIATINAFKTEIISPFKEIVAYETLWTIKNASFKKISELFKQNPGCRPSDLVSTKDMEIVEMAVKHEFIKEAPYKFNILLNGTFDFPSSLKDAKEPVEMLYYSGNLDLLSTKSIAVVGTRKPSAEGIRRTKKIVTMLVKDGYTIVSGLANGVDTVAHEAAMAAGGKTIAVIGTPINEYYPKENALLQNHIANNHLLVSQVPFIRYSQQTPYWNKLFFPERNKTMSALTKGTIIIEAGETSGTLIQAKAAIDQGRKLFILDSCFNNPNITWPEKFKKNGAVRVIDYSDITNNI